MPTINLNLSAGDANRINAAADALGYPDGKTMMITLTKQAVSSFEQRQLAETYNTPPIAPT